MRKYSSLWRLIMVHLPFVNDKVITPEVSLTNGEVSLLLVNLGRVNLKKGKNELQIESIALAPGHDTGFFGIDKLTLRK